MATKKTAGAKPPTKSEIYTQLSEDTELTKKDVGAVFDSLEKIIKKSLRGPGTFNVPGLMKVRVVKKPATKARKGINPFTKEETIFKAKPARTVLKIRPLKKMKDMV